MGQTEQPTLEEIQRAKAVLTLSKKGAQDLKLLAPFYRTAVFALEKQIPKKPTCDDENSFIRLYHCPDCKCVVTSPQRYCDNCGIKFDWGNEDDIKF